MTISYNWLCDYLPVKIEPERLSKILTSIGLEVEAVEKYESLKGGLQGIVVGEVLTCEKHPDADKLKITTVNIGTETPSQIVCGASNVAQGQKVIVATVGAMLYPTSGEPFAIKKAKIRGVESMGMICAEDEIGLGNSHDGIMVLDANAEVGTAAANLFEVYTDVIFEIGLTPNRIDAMSHLGVARDVCAYLNHHDKLDAKVNQPYTNSFKADNNNASIEVKIENAAACKRYAGVSLQNLSVKESPTWLQNKLKAIGVKSINNIVDVTNFILHETGQPLHAFDAAAIEGNSIIVKNAKEAESFVTLDDKTQKLTANDLMICNANNAMCIAGVYGGKTSGVSNSTTSIFLESAWFSNESIRKTSVQHGLRTDAATRFEKGVDISNTVNVLKRAALLIKEVAGGEIASDIIDIYPQPAEKATVGLKYHYLKKLSGKNYHADTVKNILTALGFEIQKEGIDEIWVNVPLHKVDISIPADIVEEIMRIDGLDNVEIPQFISIAPSSNQNNSHAVQVEKIANFLSGNGFNEIFTNSITDSKYYSEVELQQTVKLLNSLSNNLDIMRPSLLQTSLEVIAYNLNRKNQNIKMYEFGKVYSNIEGQYNEQNQLAIFVCGAVQQGGWAQKDAKANIYYIKGICEAILQQLGFKNSNTQALEANNYLHNGISILVQNKIVVNIGSVQDAVAKQFGIKEPVFFANIDWQALMAMQKQQISYKEISKYPVVQRDLAIVVDKQIAYAEIEKNIKANKIQKLKSINLFDVFENEKLGADKKSLAINFSFSDETKTLEDAETDAMMQTIIQNLEKGLQANIRK
jgi:phenylalanyl-tRNA synthetase beta chain